MTIKVIAHRGASAHAPENTLAAFQLALDQGADGIELDVMLSKDGQLIVIHDDRVDRTTNGTGKVAEMYLPELKVLDAGNGETLPTLPEVFDRFGGKFLINIELKNYSSLFDRLPVVVAEQVKAFRLTDSVIVSSFNPFNLPRFHRRAPEVKRGLLTQSGKARSGLNNLFRFDALHPYYEDVDAALVQAEHARGRQVNVWTVDDPDEIRRLAGLGVDMLITNDPQRTREVLEASA
jgi:glycerophosphoryl diester phosphodiesterase